MEPDVDRVAPVHISARGLTVEVRHTSSTLQTLKNWFGNVSSSSEKDPQSHRTILHGVSAELPSGSLTAIIGGSGSGKTTLLNTISERVSSKKLKISGSTRFNESSDLRSVRSAYLMQEDILLPTLSVRETLQYAVDLRLPAPSTKESRRLVVERVIGELGLKDCADTRIGNHAHKGCSGGEKRRTSIGVQMLADPSILFCDEPTTGLDANSAFQVVQTLKKLAETGRTIVMSIHAPRSEIWNLLDNVVLLSHGHTLYSGPAIDAIPHFSECGYDLGPFMNPAEFLIDLSGIDTRSEEVEKASTTRVLGLKDAWQQRCIARNSFPPLQSGANNTGNIAKVPELLNVGFKQQVSVLTKRTTKVTLRDPMGISGSFIEALIMGIVSGLVFYQLGTDEAGIRSREGALYSASAQQAYLVLMLETYRLTVDIKVFDRERSEGVVTVSAFLLSRRISRFILEDLIVPTIFTIIYYFMVGFRSDPATFFMFLAIMIILQFITIGLATLCVAVSRDFAIASLIGNTTYTLQTLGCGFFIQSQQIPVWVRWLKWTAYSFYVFGSLTANEFIGTNGGYLGQIYDCPFPDGPKSTVCQQYTGRYIMNSLGFPTNWLWRPIVASLSFIFLFFILAWVILTYRANDIDVTKARKNDEDKKGKETKPLQSPGKLPAVTVSLENYSLSITRCHLGRPRHTKTILNSITASFEAGKINVIMGPSGSGKTSLLQSLAKRLDSSLFSTYHSSGNIRLNGAIPSSDVIRSVSSFVTQDDDALMPALTVRETLRFAAKLRLPSWMSKTEKQKRADEVILKMGLKDCANNIIGNELRKGISGGEKRRVSIAIQVLTNPKVLLLDEPTSGLDAYTASSVVDLLRILAKEGRTIVMTVHQPRSSMVDFFDNILLLARGSVVYSGKGSNMLEYFHNLGYECPHTTNPADFVLDLIAMDLQGVEQECESRERVQALIQQWEEKPRTLLNTEAKIDSPAELQALKKETSSFRITFPCILQRSFLNISRTPEFVIARTMQIVGITLIFALFFSPLQSNQEAIQSRMGLVQEIAALYFIGMLQNIAIYPFDRDVFYHEHADNCYGVPTFILSYTLLEIPFEIMSSLFFGVVIAFATDLERTPIFFLISALNCFCVISCGESVGIVFCTLFSHTGFALNITSVVLTIANIMAGVISLDIPHWLKAINYLSPLKYLVANLAVYSMQGRKFACHQDQMIDGVCPISSGEEVLKLYNLDKSPGLNLMALGIVTVVYRIIAWLVLWAVKRRGMPAYLSCWKR